ncbi:Ppm1 [Carabus blaptoides fortunei]
MNCLQRSVRSVILSKLIHMFYNFNMPSKDIHTNSETNSSTDSWIDDLPLCRRCGIGLSTGRNHGGQQDRYAFEDRSFYCQLDDSTHLYGIFDGHMGPRAAEFVLQRIPAEILLGQLTERKTDEEIKEVIRQAYISVEKEYLNSLGDLLAERTSLQCELPHGLPAYEAYQKYPEIFEKLKSINYELSSGTSALISLVFNNKLYVANVGNSRALLCKTDANAVLRVVQLSVDHDLRNEDELLRLLQLGITTSNLKYGSQIGNQETTRCLGNYLVKGGYKEYRELYSAYSEPVIAEPEIHGGIHLDESCRFLLLMSAGLYKTLEEVIPANQVNKYIAQLVVEQFRCQSTLNAVAQTVVDKAIYLYSNNSQSYSGSNSSNTSVNSVPGRREDITLIIRNFNFMLQNSSDSSSSSSTSNSSSVTSTLDTHHSSTTTTSSPQYMNETNRDIHRLKPYVDFSCYYVNIRRIQDN